MGEKRRSEPGEPADVAGRVWLIGVPSCGCSRRQRRPSVDSLNEALQTEDLLVHLGGKSDLCQHDASQMASGDAERG